MKTNWSTGLSMRVADGRINSEMDTRLPIHVTTARKCSQYVSVMAQVGTVGIIYCAIGDGSVVGAVVGVSAGGAVVGASLVEAAPVAVLTGASVAG